MIYWEKTPTIFCKDQALDYNYWLWYQM